MKKIFFAFACLFLISCSSDDDNGPDKFIGKWYFVSTNVNGVDVVNDECATEAFYRFNENNLGYYASYSFNGTACQANPNVSMSWINNGGAKYTLTTVSGSTLLINKVTFNSDNTSMTWIVQDGSETVRTTFEKDVAADN